MKNLHEATKILMIRCENGWIARSEYTTDPKWVFESTLSLANNIVALFGESKWKIEPEVSVPQKPHPMMTADNFPPCKRFKLCGNTCEWYGPTGGFSVQCVECNKEKARKSRERSAKRRLSTTPK